MPAGYSSRCKICNSRHRVEVERWIKEEGISYREASKRLEGLGDHVSHVAIRRHCDEHFDVNADAREQYQRSQKEFQKAVEKQLSDIEMLDNIARGDYELHENARAWLEEIVSRREKPPKSLVDLLAVTAGEVRQQLKQKQELLGEDPTSKIAEALSVLWDDSDVELDRQEPGTTTRDTEA